MKIAILGGKESGVGAAILASKLGYAVWVSEFGVIPDKYKAELAAFDIAWEEGGHTEARILPTWSSRVRASRRRRRS
jgi:UDP-N-acetylmuramoylalanine--D-glutamate ligase